MRLVAIALLAACGGKNEEQELPPPISFKSEVSAGEVDAELPEDTAALVDTWRNLGAFLELLLSDNTIKSTFYVDGNLGTTPVVYFLPCWFAPPAGTAGFEYDVDLSGCSSEGYGGLIHVENTPQGPIVLTFDQVQYLDWVITGGLGFEFAADRTWRVYPSDPEAVDVGALSIDADGTPINLAVAAEVTYTGAPVTGLDWTGTVGDGVRTLALASSYAQQPDDCKCEVSGAISIDAAPTLTEIEVELDDLQEDDDGVDDPALVFAAEGPTGTVTLGDSDSCGFYAVSYGDLEVELDSAALEAGVEAACDGGVFEAGTCTRLREAASQGQVTVTIGATKLDNALTAWAEDRLDPGYCETSYGY
jgi:hypothetical protein